MKNLRCIALVATATAAAALAPMVTTASADAASVLMVRGSQVWPVYSPGTAEWDSQQTDLMARSAGQYLLVCGVPGWDAATSIPAGVTALDAATAAEDGPVTLFGFSQGAQVITAHLITHPDNPKVARWC